MKVDLVELKEQLNKEMQSLQEQIKDIEKDLRQIEAVEAIAQRSSKKDPVDEAVQELKKSNGKAEEAPEVIPGKTDGQSLEWAFES